MFHFGKPKIPEETYEDGQVMHCRRCGFLCDKRHDAVCPLCGRTKRETGYSVPENPLEGGK